MPDLNQNHRPHGASRPAWQAIKQLREEHGEIGLQHFQLLCRLGSGDIGSVYLCEIKSSLKTQSHYPRCYYAMKVVDRDSLRKRDKLKRADMEKEVLSLLDHPFLPTLYAHFEAYPYQCLVMDYCHGGDLFKLQQNQPDLHFNISTARFYAAEVLLALEYLHMMGIIYRDLKPENVLIQEDGHIMLSDFDLSLHLEVHPKLIKPKLQSQVTNKKMKKPTTFCCEYSEEDIKRKKKKIGAISEGIMLNEAKEVRNFELSAEPINARSMSFVGTHEYLAPEVVLGSGHGSAVDWWAFGVFLYELLYGFTPFKDENNEKTLRNITGKSFSFPETHFKDRKDCEEIVKAQDLISKLLVRNPKRRMGYRRGSGEIKKHEFFEGLNWALIRSVKPPFTPRDLHGNQVPFSMWKRSVEVKATLNDEATRQIDFF